MGVVEKEGGGIGLRICELIGENWNFCCGT
jgi:hypothetical protein